MKEKIVVVGAGIGGLTSAAILARQGYDVTVLEAHIYPGGCAGTFYHQGYRFEAGATLAGGFYAGGPMDLVAQATGIPSWPAHPTTDVMQVHLPAGAQITRYGDERRWAEQRRVFGPQAERFFRWQEQTADALWDLALRGPAWPPQSARETAGLLAAGSGWLGECLRTGKGLGLPGLAVDAFAPVSRHLAGASERLRLFVDGQLLIAAQTTSAHANALYGASALDLPRRGVIHLQGGIGALAETLAAALERNGGRILYRQEVTRIRVERGRPVAVVTKKGLEVAADRVVVNLPPWNIVGLLGEAAPPRLRALPPRPLDGWGAFTVYAGVDGAVIPADAPLHHQVLVGRPLGEGNSLFVSISPAWDSGRAPAGMRALTLSTHTELASWWELFQTDRPAYEVRKEEFARRMLAVAERAIPGLQDATHLCKPGTPVTFQRFTRRKWGWVGGFPQTNLLRAWPPRLMEGLWMVGDSIFPGQSTAAVALGGCGWRRELCVMSLEADSVPLDKV
ncbi:MAG: FAD-dependent oxidoreductase [Chloroflexi bacterium]|nr:MAG: FAD-dependent oxidoreductase [Chloroflexota bacterium]